MNIPQCIIKDGYLLFLRGPFSNFAFAGFEYKNVVFLYTENAFMYAKAYHFNDLATMKRLENTQLQPIQAKQLGRQVSNYNDESWEQVRYNYMLEINREKFKIPKYRDYLIATEDLVLVECNPNDKIWGVGLEEDDPRATDPSKWNGRNLLGEVLMQIRNEIKQGLL